MEMTAEVVDQIKSRRVVVFAGAGISRASGLPIAGEVIARVIQELATRSSLSQSALGLLEQRAPSELRLEILFRILTDVVGERGLTPLRLFAGGTPTFAHCFIAACLAKKFLGTVITTNFDTLLERACDEAHVGYRILVHHHDFAAFSGERHTNVIAKIHGSVDPKTGDAVPSTLADVRSIGQGLGAEREGFLRNVLREEQLLVIGYSGRDYFGAMPEIFSSDGPRVFWIAQEHGTSDAHIEAWLQSSGRGLFLRTDTNRWLADVAAELGVVVAEPHRSPAQAIAAQSLDGLLSTDESNLVASKILARLGENDIAAQSYRATIDACQAGFPKNRELVVRLLLDAGHHAQRLGGSQASRCYIANDLYTTALSISEDYPRLHLEAEICSLDMRFCLAYIAGESLVQYLLDSQFVYDATIEHCDPVLTARALGFMGRVLLNCNDDSVVGALMSTDQYEHAIDQLESAGAQDILGPLYLTLVQLFGRLGQSKVRAPIAIKFLRSQLLCSADPCSSAVRYATGLINELICDGKIDTTVRAETIAAAHRLGVLIAAPPNNGLDPSAPLR